MPKKSRTAEAAQIKLVKAPKFSISACFRKAARIARAAEMPAGLPPGTVAAAPRLTAGIACAAGAQTFPSDRLSMRHGCHRRHFRRITR